MLMNRRDFLTTAALAASAGLVGGCAPQLVRTTGTRVPLRIRQIRNATLVVEYSGKRFLVDPYLAGKGAYPGFRGGPNQHLSNPLVDLTVSTDEILDVDAVIVTHTHSDHWDEAARNLVPKDMLIFAQNERDAATIQGAGFSNTRVLTENSAFDGITLIKTPGQHGNDEAAPRLGEVSGVVFRHPNEKTIYVAGDTVWHRSVRENLDRYAPDVVVLNSGAAQLDGLGSIIMGKEDVYQVYRAAPRATIVASHMEAVNHAVLSRNELRTFLNERAMTQRVLVPEDGEAMSF
jgi:L-ascorbate metabolism protein UlaG (beta-lactamase superfamily)